MKTSIDLNAKGIHGMTQFMKAWASISLLQNETFWEIFKHRVLL